MTNIKNMRFGDNSELPTILWESFIWSESQISVLEAMCQWALRLDSVQKIGDAKRRIREAIENYRDPLRIAICGENNAGKSTLVNAFLGEALAVTDFLEFTFCPMTFAFNQTESARIIFKGDTWEDIAISELNDQLRKIEESDQADRVLRVEVKTNNQVLERYQLADVPGISASERNEKIANAFSQKAHAVLFVVNATLLGQTDLIDVIGEMAKETEMIGIVVNKIDQIGMDNFERAVNFVASMLSGKPLTVFPMAATLAFNDRIRGTTIDSLPSQWLLDIEERFLNPIALDEKRIKTGTVLAKLFREITGIITTVEAIYYRGNRAAELVGEAVATSIDAKEKIVAKIGQAVDRWVETQSLADLEESLNKFLSRKFDSADDFKSSISYLIPEVTIEKEVKRLLAFVESFIQEEWSCYASEIANLCYSKFSPFQIEATNQLMLSKESALREIVAKPVESEIASSSHSLVPVLDVRIQAPMIMVEADGSIMPDDVVTSAKAGLFTGGVLAAVSAALTSLTLVGSISLIGIPMGIVAGAATILYKYAQRKENQQLHVSGQKLKEFCDFFRKQVGELILERSFPDGISTFVAPLLDDRVKALKKSLTSIMWVTAGDHGDDLKEVAGFLYQGRKLAAEVQDLRLRGRTGRSSQEIEYPAEEVFSAAHAFARECFNKPRRYRVEKHADLLNDLTAVMNLEDTEINIIDRGFTSRSFELLSAIPRQAVIRVLLFDVERDSQDRTDFVRSLNLFRRNREGVVAARVVKLMNQERTPLKRFLIIGSGWVLELSTSTAKIGSAEITVYLLDKQSAMSARCELESYWSGDVEKLVTEEGSVQFVDL